MLLFLLLLQAYQATAILPAVPLTAETAVAAPTLAVRAISVRGIALPAKPVQVRFHCLANDRGHVGDCIDGSGGATTQVATFRALLTRDFDTSDPVLNAARSRLTAWRVAERPQRRGEATRSYMITETVSATDAGDDSPGRAVERPDVVLVPGAVDLSTLYPPSALRDGTGMAIQARCKVLADLSLLCRDARPRVAPGGTPPTSFVPAFALATVRAFAQMKVRPELASGGSAVGAETTLTLNWALP